VTDKQDLKAFFTFPWQHYKDHPHWVAELPSLHRDTLSKKKNPAWEYMTGEYFIALQDEKPVGTITAVVNHRHNEIHEEKVGFFGFFECIEDQAVAQALLDAAEAYLREQGVTAVRGPANFTVNEAYGLLVENFDEDPTILMPYNPPYYVNLIEGCGYQGVMDLWSWRTNFANAATYLYEEDGKTESRTTRIIRRNNERRNISVRTINMKDKSAEFQTLRELYDAAWEKNWGHVPMTDRELDNLVKDLGFLLMPEYTFFGMVEGKPAGFMLLIPDFNDVLKHVRPRPGIPEPWWLIKALWHWKIRSKVKSARMVLFGVVEEYRSLGVDAAMLMTLAEQMITEKRLESVEASWVLETNDQTNRLLDKFGAIVFRKHRIYEKSL
jgi:GNAT superfamily N-acetyltransferase